MGRIGEWAPVGLLFAGFVNTFAAPAVAKRLAGVAPDRKLPQFAPRTFRAQFKRNGAGDPVVLFDDTFNNHFRPQPQRPRTSSLPKQAARSSCRRAAYAAAGPITTTACWMPPSARCLTF